MYCAALTRRFEENAQTADREFGIVKSDLTALRLQVGNLDQKLDGFIAEQRRVNATLVELLTSLAGKDPNAS
ncbi:hypothetical protein [Streptomyces sp. C10]|uniref:hypothetical protein n=1 Tax=Streptomyces sp. C10 TaxID=531941 RepID=UPI0039806FB6